MQPTSPDQARAPLSTLLKAAGGSLVLKGVNLLFGLMATAFLGRILMPRQYGFYSFASTVVTLLALPVQCGLPQLMTREIAKYQLVGKWGHIRGLLLRANQLVALLGIAMMAMLALALPMLARHVPAVDRPTFIWAIVLLPLIALNRLRGGALIGLRKIVLGMLPDNGIRAILFLAFIGLWYWLLPFNSAIAMALQVGATAIAFLAGAALLMRHLPPQVRSSVAAYESRSWIASIIPLTLTDALLIFNLQADLLILGVFRDAADVGIYRAATLVAIQITVGLAVANEVLAPNIARRHQAGDRAGLQTMMRHALGWLALSGLGLAGFCFLARREILIIVFGPAYADGTSALAILAVSQFIAVTTGIGSVLLNMTNHEKDVLRVFAVSAAANVAANLILIPHFGLIGAAVATTLCQFVTNGLLLHLVHRRLGLRFLPTRQ